MTYEELCSFEVLYKAYLEARKGKRSKSKTIEYEAQAGIEASVYAIDLPEVQDFIKEFIPGFAMTLDQISR